MRSSEPFRLPWLDPARPDQPFPAPELALREPNGLLAFGGDLSTARLLNAYRHGIFPWYSGDEPILWWSPNPRCVFRPAAVHVSRSLRKVLRKQDFTLSFDTAFEAVVQACAEPRGDQAGTWLTPAMIDAYIRLHREGWAHSAEVWWDAELIGGIYGVAIGGAFFGESMFSRAPNGSKIALVALAQRLQDWSFSLLDAQVSSPHLHTLGAMDLPRGVFLAELAAALRLPGRRGSWSAECAD